MSKSTTQENGSAGQTLAPVSLLAGVELIRSERQRQISKEGWTAANDDRHRHFQMTRAAICYAAAVADPEPRDEWPWAMNWWKPSNDPVRNLEKAGALIAAEIDRILRLRAKPANDEVSDRPR